MNAQSLNVNLRATLRAPRGQVRYLDMLPSFFYPIPPIPFPSELLTTRQVYRDARRKVYPIPRPLPQQAREGERAESRWYFMLIFVLCCAFIHSFINESPFPSSLLRTGQV